MNASSLLDELKWSLQTLAVSPELQREQFPSFVCLADELALEFDHSWKAAADNHAFTLEQRSILAELDVLFDGMSGTEHAELWTEQALGDAPEWQQIRRFARRALESLRWPETTTRLLSALALATILSLGTANSAQAGRPIELKSSSLYGLANARAAGQD